MKIYFFLHLRNKTEISYLIEKGKWNKKFYDNGFKSSFSYFDLMDHLNDEGVFENNE